MKRALFFLLSTTLFATAQTKALFYMTDNPNSVQSFLQHADKVDILVPAWYSTDGNGLVWGGPNPAVMKSAADQHVPVMPIVALMHQLDLHKLLTTQSAKSAFIDTLVSESKKNGYSGFQIDFENVNWTDKDLLSALVAETASVLHREHLQLTIATVPNAPGFPGKSNYSHWLYANWRGSFDLKALAQSADLICLMTYDQNTRWTMPGPVAGYPWTVDNVNYALQFVPKEKLSMGIPLYGYHWFAGDPGKEEKPNPTAEYIGQEQVEQYTNAYHPQVQWDATDRVSWFYFYRDDMRDWVFYTDKRGFQERLNLVREKGLQGFCSWVLGTEDPEIWSLLPSHK
ncbi:MAG TPA: glycosyl hydrolase family 18 protein [Candidatus Eisenbacteria bacterium]|nr:glycosyl hydrolase family 18 protein [Candidatus Eisenbacteria bacterium]